MLDGDNDGCLIPEPLIMESSAVEMVQMELEENLDDPLLLVCRWVL